MNMDLESTSKWLEAFEILIKKDPPKNKVILAGSFSHLYFDSEFVKKFNLECSAQDVSEYDRGAHTGSVGAFEIAELCKYAIVGHSERNEPKDVVFRKRDQCIKNGLTPIVCFVNPTEIRNYYHKDCLLAWEDPTNISKSGIYKETNQESIKEIVANLRADIPSSGILLYGGSVNKQNVNGLVNISGIDGFLVGNASLNPEHFYYIVKAFEK